MSEKNTSGSQTLQLESRLRSYCLISDIDAFIARRSADNENFCYWEQFVQMFQVLRNLIRADREGLWELHIEAVQEALHLFAAFDCIHYLRWGSLYLEDMRKLPETAPDVYDQFMSGGFAIKENPGRFVSTGGDQKLEQTINFTSKNSASVIGHSKQKHFIAQWDLLYHERVGINRLDRKYSGDQDIHNKAYVHHEASKSYTTQMEQQLQDMIKEMRKNGLPVDYLFEMIHHKSWRMSPQRRECLSLLGKMFCNAWPRGSRHM